MIESGVALSTAFYTSVGGMSFGFSFLVVRWFASFIAGRMDKRQEHLDEATRELINGLRTDVKELREWRSRAEAELIECERKHSQSEAKVARLEATLAGFGDARQHAQLIVASEKAQSKKSGEGE